MQPNQIDMDIERISKRVECSPLHSIRANDCSCDAFFVPTGLQNKQKLLVNDYTYGVIKVYEREREDKDSLWGEWNFSGTIS